MTGGRGPDVRPQRRGWTSGCVALPFALHDHALVAHHLVRGGVERRLDGEPRDVAGGALDGVAPLGEDEEGS